VALVVHRLRRDKVAMPKHQLRRAGR
jgi:hypothetical protein